MQLKPLSRFLPYVWALFFIVFVSAYSAIQFQVSSRPLLEYNYVGWVLFSVVIAACLLGPLWVALAKFRWVFVRLAMVILYCYLLMGAVIATRQDGAVDANADYMDGVRMWSLREGRESAIMGSVFNTIPVIVIGCFVPWLALRVLLGWRWRHRDDTDSPYVDPRQRLRLLLGIVAVGSLVLVLSKLRLGNGFVIPLILLLMYTTTAAILMLPLVWSLFRQKGLMPILISSALWLALSSVFFIGLNFLLPRSLGIGWGFAGVLSLTFAIHFWGPLALAKYLGFELTSYGAFEEAHSEQESPC